MCHICKIDRHLVPTYWAITNVHNTNCALPHLSILWFIQSCFVGTFCCQMCKKEILSHITSLIIFSERLATLKNPVIAAKKAFYCLLAITLEQECITVEFRIMPWLTLKNSRLQKGESVVHFSVILMFVEICAQQWHIRRFY